MLEPQVTIGIVSYNQSGLFDLCLKSVVEHLDVPAIIQIVDNGSTDTLNGFYENEFWNFVMRAKEFNPNIIDIRLQRNKTNLYLSTATNQCFAKAVTPYLMFVPSDVILPQNFLSRLFQAKNQYNLEIVSPRWFESKMLPGGQTPDIENPLDWTNGWDEAFIANKVREDIEYGWAVGICYLCSVDLWQKVGGWSTAYKLTCQDNDFLWRALIALGDVNKAGIVGNMYIYHAGPVSRMNEELNPGWSKIGDADYQKFIEIWGTTIDDHFYLVKLISEGKARRKVEADGPSRGIPAEIKEKRITS